MARGSAGESVLHKHLRVLDAFDALHPFRTLSEIAEAAGLAPSTAHRLVAELTAEGLLERMSDRTYQLGVRLWEFGARTPGALGLRELARPWLTGVHNRIRQHTQLGILSGRDVIFIERMSTRDAVVNATLIGGRIPLPMSSIGLVLLAHADESLVDEVIAAGWPQPTEHTVADAAGLRQVLPRVRADGHAVTDGFIHEQSRGIAVPVFGPLGGVYAGLGVVVPNDGTRVQGMIETLMIAAAGIRAALENAYHPDAGRVAVGPLVSTSTRSIEYFSARAQAPGDTRPVS